MSGESVPYHLRPNKFIDREIFVELLGYVERYAPVRDHVYIGFGGPSLEDFKLVHYRFGMERMLSIERDSRVVSRQEFNRPFAHIRCTRMESGELIANLEVKLIEAGFAPDAQLIVWLDYTSPAEVRAQVQEFQSLLQGRQPHDIVKVTLNANPRCLYEGKDDDPPELLPEKRLEELRNRLDEYLPADLTSEMMHRDRYPVVLCRVLEKAAYYAFSARRDRYFQPLAALRYADSVHQMLTLSGIVLSIDETDEFYRRSGLDRWLYGVNSWDRAVQIDVAHLTLPEKLCIEHNLPNKSNDEILEELGFLLAGSREASLKVLEQYRLYYRYYPHFHRVSY